LDIVPMTDPKMTNTIRYNVEKIRKYI